MNLKYFKSLILIGFLSVSCSNSNQIKVSYTNFSEVIQLTQNLVFTFNKDLVSTDDLNAWISGDYLEISPKVEGKYRWTAKNELTFSPAVGFAPSTKYALRVKSTVASKSKMNAKLASNQNYSFHTPYPEIEQTLAYWTKEPSGQPTVKVKLGFNYPVNAEGLSTYLTVKDDDRKLSFAIKPADLPNELKLSVNQFNNADQIDINLNAGAKFSQYQLPKGLTSSIDVPSKDLEILETKASFSETTANIKVVFNHEIPQNIIPNFVSLSRERLMENGKVHAEVLPYNLTYFENGFNLISDAAPGDVVNLKIDKGLQSVIGATLSDHYTEEIVMGDMQPTISFSNKKGMYLSLNGNKNLSVQIANIPKVNVKISRIYENNILPYLRQNRSGNYGEYYDPSQAKNFYYYGDDTKTYSDVIVNKDVDARDLPSLNGASLLNLNIPNQDQNKGVFLVSVGSSSEYYLNDTRLVSISDIGLIAKTGRDQLMVFCNGIHSAEPLADVDIRLISTNNQTILTEKTDGNGVLVVNNLAERMGNFELGMIIASKANDSNYLILEGSEIETSRFEVEGKKQSLTGLDAFIYGDRNIYRPGEVLHFNTVLRDIDMKTQAAVPLKFKLLSPNGKEVFMAKKETNKQGAVALDIPTTQNFLTGTYILELLSGTDVLISSKSISIEEFLPDRLKVEVQPYSEKLALNQPIQINAKVAQMYGPPAAGKNYEVSFSYKQRAFTPKKYSDFDFTVAQTVSSDNIVRNGLTNAQGMISEQYLLDAGLENRGMLEAKTYITVFDESNRPVNRLQTNSIATQTVFFGAKIAESYIATQSPMRLEMVALNAQEQPVNARAIVEVVRNEYQTAVERLDGSFSYVSKKIAKPIKKVAVNFSKGKGSFSYTPTVSGDYDLRIYAENSSTWVEKSFYAYKYGATASNAFEVNNEGHVDIAFDKEIYKPGETAKILFKAPFVGKMLVTVERDKVLEYHYINTDQKAAFLNLKLNKGSVPNIYVSATLFKPMGSQQSLPLTVATGYNFAKVEDATKKMEVEIVAPKVSRSSTKQKIIIKTKNPGAQITIAVVDEGILQVKDFKTPDIFGSFYSKRALEVKQNAIYPFLYPELSMMGLSSVGGDGMGLQKRINPMANGKNQLVAIWSGVLDADWGGDATLDIDIPEYSGDLRIMAVAYDDDQFGSANQSMIVKDPVVLSGALPKALAIGDQMSAVFTVANTTAKLSKVSLSLSATGLIKTDFIQNQQVVLKPNEEINIPVNFSTGQEMGTSVVSFRAKSTEGDFVKTIPVSVRPSVGLQKLNNAGTLSGTQTKEIDIPSGFVANTAKYTFTIGYSPLVQYQNLLKQLATYPHGCAEQTISKAFPQIYLADMYKNLGIKSAIGKSDFNPISNVQNAISAIEAFQVADGGLGLWQTQGESNWWLSAYAAHFLVEAKANNYVINEAFLGKLLNNVNQNIDKKTAIISASYFNEDGSKGVKIYIKPEIAYSLYVLAKAGKANRAAMNHFKGQADKMLNSSRYILAAAYQLIGSKTAAKQLYPSKLVEQNANFDLDESFSSTIRNTALAMDALLETQPDHYEIPYMARSLMQSASNLPLNTQEQAFALMALGKYAKKLGQSNQKATIWVDGKKMGDFKAGQTSFIIKSGAKLKVAASGSGTLFYSLQTEGQPINETFALENRGLYVARTYFTTNGRQISSPDFVQNQLVVVRLTVASKVGPLRNIALTDILPGGLEIENPRVNPEREMAWAKDMATPDFMDIRDDRINIFTNLETPKNFYYIARAVTKGKYKLGLVSADAMYDATVFANAGSGICTVR